MEGKSMSNCESRVIEWVKTKDDSGQKKKKKD